MDDIIEKIKNLNVLVIGDIILDKYYSTTVDRISPEASVPVALFKDEKNILGGASNVALNIKNLGANVSLLGFVGDDNNGKVIGNELAKRNIDLLKVVPDNFDTIAKIRILSGNNQLLRLDFEEKVSKQGYLIEELKKEIKKVIDKIDVIIVSDYQKGVLSQEIIDYLGGLNKYISIDTKPGSFTDFRGFNFIKPNFKEAVGIARKLGNFDEFNNNDQGVDKLGGFLYDKLGVNLLITRSDEGVSYIGGNKITHSKLETSKVYDVVGAGDTSIAIFSLLDYLGLDINKCLEIMNVAAKITISNIGTYAPTFDEIKKELFAFDMKKVYHFRELGELRQNLKDKKIVFTNGCFDILHKGHVTYLNKAKELGDVLVVGLNSDDSVRKLKGDLRPVIDEESRGFVLSHLQAVDYVVIFDQDTPCELISLLKPDIHVKGGDYTVDDLPEAKIVKSYGGKVVIMNLEEGFSTSKIVSKIENSRR